MSQLGEYRISITPPSLRVSINEQTPDDITIPVAITGTCSGMFAPNDCSTHDPGFEDISEESFARLHTNSNGPSQVVLEADFLREYMDQSGNTQSSLFLRVGASTPPDGVAVTGGLLIVHLERRKSYPVRQAEAAD